MIRKIRFRILSDLKVQSWVFKKLTLTVKCCVNSFLNSIFFFEIWVSVTMVTYLYVPVLVLYWWIAREFVDNFQVHGETVAKFRFMPLKLNKVALKGTSQPHLCFCLYARIRHYILFGAC